MDRYSAPPCPINYIRLDSYPILLFLVIAHWVMENYGEEAAKAGFYMLDFEPRNVEGGLVLERQHGGVAK